MGNAPKEIREVGIDDFPVSAKQQFFDLDRRLLGVASRLRSAPAMTRVVVAIDPAVTSGDEADETGIIVAGKATTATAMCWPTSRGVIRRSSGPAWRSPPTGRIGPTASSPRL